jgi:hypothetical protein
VQAHRPVQTLRPGALEAQANGMPVANVFGDMQEVPLGDGPVEPGPGAQYEARRGDNPFMNDL